MRLRLCAVLIATAAALGIVSACGSGSNDPETTRSSTPTLPATREPNGATGTAVPQSTPEATIKLGEAEALYSVTLSGVGDIKQGVSAIATGDFNGDGVDDLLIGAPYAPRDASGGESAGQAYVIFGSPGFDGALDLAAEGADLLIRGAIGGDTAGLRVATGDLNGDGIDDVIVAAPASHSLENIRTDMGEVYVIFGRSDLGGVVDILESEQDFTLLPAEGFARLGSSLAVADLNGDGIDDLVTGAPFGGREPNTPPGGPRTTVGEVYVVFGSRNLSGQRTVARNEEDVLISGARELDAFGASLAAADVNADGRMDLVIGSPGFEADGREKDSGAVFVYYAPSSLWPERLTTSDADIVIPGLEPRNRLGEEVRAADLDDDGAAEVVAGGQGAAGPDGRGSAGRVYIISVGGRTGIIDPAVSATIIYGPDFSSRLPLDLLVADADADGAPDIVGSAVLTQTSEGGVAGAVYVVRGPIAEGELDLRYDLSGVVVIEAAGTDDGTGTGLALGDVNGDGMPELILAVAGVQTADAQELTRPVILALNLTDAPIVKRGEASLRWHMPEDIRIIGVCLSRSPLSLETNDSHEILKTALRVPFPLRRGHTDGLRRHRRRRRRTPE